MTPTTDLISDFEMHLSILGVPLIGYHLVGGDWNHGILNDFPIILGIVIPTDFRIFFRG